MPKRTTKKTAVVKQLTEKERADMQLSIVKAIIDANKKGLLLPDIIEAFMYATLQTNPGTHLKIKVT